MAILGESFNSYVKDQITTRQDKLALKDKDDDIIRYTHDKTSFLRLTSGVNVNAIKSTELGYPNYDGNQLAKDYVLFSSYFNDSFTQDIGYAGTSTSYGFSSDSKYGYVPPPGLISADVKSLNRGSLREATINLICHNLYQFKIISTLYLKLRYSILLEWGHTMFFSNPTENNGVTTPSILKTRFEIPNLSSYFLDPTNSATAENILDEIESARRKSSGNYDAFFGVVKNFNWELLENGSYSVTINAISTGDVIESLKINANTAPDATTNGTPANQIYQKSTIHKILGTIIEKIESKNGIGSLINGFKETADSDALDSDTISAYTTFKYGYKHAGDSSSTRSANSDLSKAEGILLWWNRLEVDPTTGGSLSQYYLKLGALLRIIESFLLSYDTDKTNPPPAFFIDHNYDTNECFTIPNQIAIDPRVCLIPFGNVSTSVAATAPSSAFTKITTSYTFLTQPDPNDASKLVWEFTGDAETYDDTLTSLNGNILDQEKIILPVTGKKRINNLETPKNVNVGLSVGQVVTEATIKSRIDDFIGSYQDKIGFQINIVTEKYVDTIKNAAAAINLLQEFNRQFTNVDTSFRTNDKFIGKLMHLYVNIDEVIRILDENIDEDGVVSVYDLLTSLMTSIKKSLGYINDFEIVHREDINTYYIVDNSLIPLKYKNSSNTAKFNINLLREENSRGGSFITNFGLKSELFARIANAIAIGAQDYGNTLISNSTAFSEFNKGLKDRFLTTKSNPNIAANSDNDISRKYVQAYKKYGEYIRLLTAANGVNVGLVDTDISYFESFITDLFQYDVGYYTTKQAIPGTGFIPLNLQLSMDGLSGIKIYQTFEIDTTLLPTEYKNRIRFIIRGVNHKIDEKGWISSIETLSIPKLAGKAEKVENPDFTLPTGPTGAGQTPYTEAEILEKTKNFSVAALGAGPTWQSIATKYIVKKEGFTKVGKMDQGTPRAGYGSDKILRGGARITVTIGMVVTKDEAIDSLENYSIDEYSSEIINDLGSANWNKLNNNQKAALVSLGYNAGKSFISSRTYGQKIKSFIAAGDLQKAGETIYTDGPRTGKVEGYLRGLHQRRKEESLIFLTP